ncbi:MAG: hypothetical protein R3Y24_07430 [Eubacteriales bacterium]
MNDTIYTFGEKDITLNVCIQIRAVVRVIQHEENIDFENAMIKFYNSETYKILQNTDNALWAESAEYIADCFFNEIKSTISS